MIHVANIIPTNFLPIVSPLLDSLPRINLLLSHQVLNDKKYVEYYLKRKKQGDYIVLDNSAFEFGEALSIDLLIRAIKITKPNEFVLPDVFFNKNESIRRSIEFIESFSFGSLKYMGVVQGESLEDWLSCYKYFSENIDIFSIGLGAIYTSKTIFGNKNINKIVSGREFLINELKERKILNQNKPHHLLGLGDSGHIEIEKLKKYKWIRSCDSSAAYIQARQGVEISMNNEYSKIKEKINLNDKLDKDIIDLVIKNMQHLNEAGK